MLSNEFIASLRNKYNTSIDDFDLKLSGTQITCSVVDSNGIKSKLGYVKLWIASIISGGLMKNQMENMQ